MYLGVCLDVARGYAELSQGFPRAARATLEPVLAELSDAGLPPVLALAAALLAYSEALCGNLGRPWQGLGRARPPAGSRCKVFFTQLSALYLAAAQDQARASHAI